MRFEVENIVATVKTKVHESFFSALEFLVVHRMEVAMSSVSFSSTHHLNSVVLDPGLSDLSGDTNHLQTTDSSRYKSNINLDRFDDTRDNITVEEGDLLVSGKKFQPGDTRSLQCQAN